MDILIGRDDKKKKAEKVEVKKVIKTDTKVLNKALDDLQVLLAVVYSNKPCMEIYDAQIHLGQLRRSIIAAKL